MAVDAGLGIGGFELFEKLQERSLLDGRASVLGSELPVWKPLGCVRATDIANADGVGVVTRAVGTDLLDRSAIVD